jgi:hypothetical protein
MIILGCKSLMLGIACMQSVTEMPTQIGSCFGYNEKYLYYKRVLMFEMC